MKSILSICLALLISSVSNAQVMTDSDDTIPNISDRTATIRSQQSVKIEKTETLTITTADNEQDAVNASVEECGKSDISCCVKMTFPSGEGYMAMGIASYQLVPNVDKHRVLKRQAYVKAYIEAKASLASTLGTPEVSGQINVDQYSEDLLDDDKTRQNRTEGYTEKINTIIRHLIQGHVIYKVEDDQEENVIRVWIFTTPKTALATARQTGGVYMDAVTLRDGITKVFDGIKKGVVPPVGGTIVTVPGTEAIAFVSFGSSPILSSKDKSQQFRNKQNAYNRSDMIASFAMLELLNGDNIQSHRKMLESSKESVNDFIAILDEDPTDTEAFASIERLEEQSQERENIQQIYRSTSSGQKGELPPGINSQTWVDQDGIWVYTVKVYIPTKDVMPPEKPTKDAEQELENTNMPTGIVTDPSTL